MEKIYRPNVSAVIMDENYPDKEYYFIASRIDLDDVWQFPQGGVSFNESIHKALCRELYEEIGTSNFDILDLYDEWIYYDFKKNIVRDGVSYSGQKQKYFLVKLNDNTEINLTRYSPEFIDYEFVSYEKLLKKVSPFKKEIYNIVLNYFSNKGFLSCL